MKRKLFGVAVATLFVFGLTLPALAGDAAQDAADAAESAGHAVKKGAEATGSAIKSGAEYTGHKVKQGAEAVGHVVKKGAIETGEALGLTAQDEAYERNEMGEHRMSGKITNIDSKLGIVSIHTEEAPLKLQFPKDTVADLREGQEVAVQLAFAPTTGQKETQRAYDNPKTEMNKENEKGHEGLKAEHWVTGKITEIDHAKGVFHLETAETTLHLHFPPSSIRHLEKGQKVAVEMALATTAKSK